MLLLLRLPPPLPLPLMLGRKSRTTKPGIDLAPGHVTICLLTSRLPGYDFAASRCPLSIA